MTAYQNWPPRNPWLGTCEKKNYNYEFIPIYMYIVYRNGTCYMASMPGTTSAGYLTMGSRFRGPGWVFREDLPATPSSS